MKISQFTKNELDLFRKECNFTELELACFNLKAENLFSHTKQDLDAATVKQGVHDGLQMWVDWKKETKLLYENMYSELLDIGEISDTIILRELVSDVTNELALAIEYKMNKELTNYDMVLIIEEQR